MDIQVIVEPLSLSTYIAMRIKLSMTLLTIKGRGFTLASAERFGTAFPFKG